jgi:predicted TIM-barrel fold metal-dependent hydrolase
MSSRNLDWLISVDDHVLEPAHVWQERLPAKHRERGPRLVSDADGEAWVFEDKRVPTSGIQCVAGKEREEFSPEPVTYAEMRPGCYDPVARLEDMDRAGVLASINFPSFPRFCGQVFYEATDKELGLACIKAYNDWMIDEWCGAAPGRYIPMTLIPLWDPQEAAREVERCAALGSRAVAFSENPAPLGLPTIHDPSRYWEPFLAACADNEIVINIHVGSSSSMMQVAPDAPPLANLTFGAARSEAALLAWLFADWFDRYPTLKVALSEGNVGWMPYYLERAQQVVEKQRYWVSKGIEINAYDQVMANAPQTDLFAFDATERFRRHIFGCFIEDHAGISMIERIGEDNIMIETDYPHSDSTWPNCIEAARKQIGHLDEEVQYKILRGNAERLYRFTPAEPPSTPST